MTSTETLLWKGGYQRQEESKISGAGRHTDTELAVLLVPTH